MRIIALAAMDEARVIGYQGTLPWKLPSDMKRFASLTKGHTVLMGRKTYESLPPKFRPLPERKNIVISKTLDAAQGTEIWSSPNECIEYYKKGKGESSSGTLWIIGGAKIYDETKEHWDEVFLTRVPGVHLGDTWFPAFEENFTVVSEEDGEGCSFLRYART